MASTTFTKLQKRLRMEMKQLDDETDWIRYSYQPDSSITQMSIFMKGPEDTPYSNFWYEFTISFQSKNNHQSHGYPFLPPSIVFETRSVEHVNIMKTKGRICLDILTKEWSPIYTLRTLFTSIRSLFAEPNPSSALNGNLAVMYSKHDNDYIEDYLRRQVEKYALTSNEVDRRCDVV